MTFPEGTPFIPDEKDTSLPCQKSAEHMERLAEKSKEKDNENA